MASFSYPFHVGPRARLAGGVVEGTLESDLAVFRGIPFAKAPFGPLRFLGPVREGPWDGVRSAASFGPSPPQTTRLPSGSEPASADPSPDCLTLNVWTPDPSAGLPVMVWIYGGAYLLGSSDQPVYDGSHLAREGVVLVTLNYRLGAEGFASLEGAPENRGLLDQVEALKWVQENIAGFGGDPGRVTVFGESAGAGSIAALFAMPAAHGLFRRAILQSVPGTYFSARFGRDVAERIGAELGVSPSVADFSTRTPAQLAEATAQLQAKMPGLVDSWGKIARTVTPFSPVVDGETLLSAPWEAVAAGSSNGVEIIAGFMRDEYRVFHSLDGTLERADDAEADFMVGLLGPDGESLEDGLGAASAYRAAYPEKSPGELIEVTFSDWLFRMATLRLAEHHVAAGGRAFLYEVRQPAPAEGGRFGACHGFDVPLTFGNFTGLGSDYSAQLLGEGPPTPDVLAVSTAIRAAWTGFAKTGDPGWSPFDADRQNARLFGGDAIETDAIEDRSARLWKRHRFAEMDLVAG